MQHGKALLATALLLSVNTITAQATVTAVDNGLGIYESGTNVTWTSDANLLGTLETNQGYTSVINAIIQANNRVVQTINGTHDLVDADFNVNGTADWWGAQAFVGYLNSIVYGNSDQWVLPTNTVTLYGQAYNATPSGISSSILVANRSDSGYWSSTVSNYSFYPNSAWAFTGWFNSQSYATMDHQYLVWAISPGVVAAPVPVPAAIWLFSSVLLGIGLIGKRRAA
ncbi:hypothetical protein [Methylomonas sp. AM2-LC]|uniref:hypothetical protein n=1 Tax=Methylomonas sp. AM2-LC TaxID=3153301 RepID=UPI0032634117